MVGTRTNLHPHVRPVQIGSGRSCQIRTQTKSRFFLPDAVALPTSCFAAHIVAGDGRRRNHQLRRSPYLPPLPPSLLRRPTVENKAPRGRGVEAFSADLGMPVFSWIRRSKSSFFSSF